MTAARTLREARSEDHPAFLRLFPELAIDDPPLDLERFTRELVPTTLVVESAAGVDGYAFFQTMKTTAYVCHIVTAPGARRSGVGKALMAAVVERARRAGCTSWCLNVKPGNVAAIALYERMGLARAFESRALKITWAAIEAANIVHSASVESASVEARLVEPAEDARVERATDMIEGRLATARALGERVVMALHEHGEVVGGALFAPAFPGAYPFRVARPELAFTLLEALRPHAFPEHDYVKVVVEGQPRVADALVAAGAEVHLDIVHMKGPLPAA